MAPLQIITIAASIAGVLALLYVAVFGSRSLSDWWRERDRNTSTKPSTFGPASTLHNTPQSASPHFINRREELDKLQSLLSHESRHFLISIEGFAGIGKTALAQASSTALLSGDLRSLDRFGAIIWISAKRISLTSDGLTTRGKTQLTLDDLFTTVSIVLRREDIRKAPQGAQEEAVRAVLSEQRTLLIVDSQEAIDDPAVLSFLRELPSPTKALITSRQRLSTSYSLHLDPLPESHAERLIDAECHEKHVRLSEKQRAAIVQSTAGIPMAIVWSIAEIGRAHV